MGQIGSKSFSELSESSMHTPPVKSKTKRFPTAFDPRSPTDDISRTPIQVESPTTASVADPRSPSEQIVRTPIYDKLSGKIRIILRVAVLD